MPTPGSSPSWPARWMRSLSRPTRAATASPTTRLICRPLNVCACRSRSAWCSTATGRHRTIWKRCRCFEAMWFFSSMPLRRGTRPIVEMLCYTPASRLAYARTLALLEAPRTRREHALNVFHARQNFPMGHALTQTGLLMSFASLGLSEALVGAVEAAGYTEPTPVQQRAVPAVLQGRDLMVAAQTGTGKTAGFALPILERLFPGGHPDRE